MITKVGAHALLYDPTGAEGTTGEPTDAWSYQPTPMPLLT